MIQHFEPYEVRPRTDLYLVPQIGWIDLRVAYASGVISGDIESVEGNYNEIDDPRSILGKPDDVFSALRASSSVETAAAPAAGQPSVPSESNNEGA